MLFTYYFMSKHFYDMISHIFFLFICRMPDRRRRLHLADKDVSAWLMKTADKGLADKAEADRVTKTSSSLKVRKQMSPSATHIGNLLSLSMYLDGN
jgi:hypothetical protein